MTTSPATRPAGTPGASSATLSGVDAGVRWSTRQCCRGVERMRVGRRAAAFFPLAASYRFCGDQGPGRGVGGARRGLRHEGGGAGRCERGREQKEARELSEKRRGTSASLYLAKDRAGR